ncbi:MAG: Alpha-amylase [Candidatus Jettenia ecosi]|uniref:Alpha-1,4-glucan:maltose-1-phosphate maltosyltransferase n=1 Tax=Candidatus Jettenia ecosi TaxID=2494326 RepID=A0A533QEX8_9BACT|nr:MAG: Alpha-amylase [Candidatus Jettenia ecosi]
MQIDGRRRVIIENIKPEIACGHFSVKRIIGEKVVVTADVFSDGHDAVWANVLYRGPEDNAWREIPMQFKENDRWEGKFVVEKIGMYLYTVEGGIDYFKTWQNDLKKKFDANQDIKIDISSGMQYIEEASKRASEDDKKKLWGYIDFLEREENKENIVSVILTKELTGLMHTYKDRRFVTNYRNVLTIVVDRSKALFSAWYERFPRSCSSEPNTHGTLKDCETILPEIAEMGFDVFYLPPIHPIGKTNRKGKNNSTITDVNDVGSPWAIGSHEGGHKSIHPQMGTIEDFERLVQKAKDHGIEIAMDLAFQCSPDHPYVKEHPEWFKWRPDGSVQHAENPPKKYEDVLPLNFETEHWLPLWEELRSIVIFWVEKGISIFRVDNPHTKPFAFWEWLIKEIKNRHPHVLFLSEAFARPKVMCYLAKLGFTQSYTYFTWRNTKKELIQYNTELTQTEVREYFRPNFWPNTPDILPEYLQYGGAPAFMIRLVLAATLSSSYGIFGPAFDLCVHEAIPGKEEYLNSEKYEIRYWYWDKPGNLKDFIARVNRIRRENSALQTISNLQFCEIDNDYLLSYEKATEDLSNILLIVVNLDAYHTQSGFVRVPIDRFGIEKSQPYLAHDLLSDDTYIWQGEKNYVELNPGTLPARIFKIRKRLRKEIDFDYFM